MAMKDREQVMLKAALSLLTFFLMERRVMSQLHAQQLWAMSSWNDAHATFYGALDGLGTPNETMGGACGYADLFQEGYGMQEYTLRNAALSLALLNDGLTCGACFEIKCQPQPDRDWCHPGEPSIIVTATNECPENLTKPSNNGGWCNRPRTHFDLAYPMFTSLARPIAGIIPVSYRRVPCVRQGGIRFTMDVSGNKWWILVLVHNVAGGGDVAAVAVRPQGSNFWSPMDRVWGQKWASRLHILGKSLSFRVTLGSGESLTVSNVVPEGWRFGPTFEALSTVQTQSLNFGTPTSY